MKYFRKYVFSREFGCLFEWVKMSIVVFLLHNACGDIYFIYSSVGAISCEKTCYISFVSEMDFQLKRSVEYNSFSRRQELIQFH